MAGNLRVGSHAHRPHKGTEASVQRSAPGITVDQDLTRGGFCFCAGIETEPERAAAVSPSIAVLPFANFGPDSQNDYFSDGLAEELINAFARIPSLHVASRTAASHFRGSTDFLAIGRELRVDHFLEGSVRRCGTRLRITARLVNVADGYHLWSSQYEREMTDGFGISTRSPSRLFELSSRHLLSGDSRGRSARARMSIRSNSM